MDVESTRHNETASYISALRPLKLEEKRKLTLGSKILFKHRLGVCYQVLGAAGHEEASVSLGCL